MNKFIGICLIVVSSFAHASQIPMPEQARVFADYTEKQPFVISYFTDLNEQALVSFYQEKLGDIKAQSRKRERLQLFFESDIHKTRVIISTQKNATEVNIFQHKKPSN